MRNILLLISFLCIPILKNQAQEIRRDLNYSKYVLSVQPQYIFIRAVRADIDIRLKESQNWLIISPKFHQSNNDYIWSFYFDNWMELGLDISHRYYPVLKQKPEGFYLQYGLSYNLSQLSYEGNHWITTDYDGQDAWTVESTELKDNIHKAGLNLLIGYQVLSADNFVVDWYIGAGYRNSWMNKSDPSSREISGGILNPAYKGFLPLIGYRIGVTF